MVQLSVLLGVGENSLEGGAQARLTEAVPGAHQRTQGHGYLHLHTREVLGKEAWGGGLEKS